MGLEIYGQEYEETWGIDWNREVIDNVASWYSDCFEDACKKHWLLGGEPYSEDQEYVDRKNS